MAGRLPTWLPGLLATVAVAAGCAAVPTEGPTVDLGVETKAPRGFSLTTPALRLAGSDLLVRGAVCRLPLSQSYAPRALLIELFANGPAPQAVQRIALAPIPARRGARCAYYTARVPASVSMRSVVVSAVR